MIIYMYDVDNVVFFVFPDLSRLKVSLANYVILSLEIEHCNFHSVWIVD